MSGAVFHILPARWTQSAGRYSKCFP